MLTVRSIAKNIAESIAFPYIETYGHNSEVNVHSQWYINQSINQSEIFKVA